MVGPVVLVVAILMVGAAILALVAGQAGTDSTAASPTPSGAVADTPTITGDPLPQFVATVDDPAVGRVAPAVSGHDDNGTPVDITPGESPTVVIFAAHWCSHCQRELPLIQAWIEAGSLPADVEVVTVSTGIDPSLPNYPPAAWFERIGWTASVMVDPTNTVAAAYGLSAYPFFVMLDAEGRVVGRAKGEVGTDVLEGLIAAAR
jgi:thiol-disulfide isomerase/thioredoxin